MRNYRSSLLWLLLVAFLFAQVLPVTAAGTQYQDPNSNTPTQAPTFADNSAGAVNSASDQLANYYFNQYKNSYDWDWLKTTNVNFSAFSGNTPQWNINTFQPFGFSDDQGKFLFNSLESMKSMDKFGFLQAQYGTGNNTFNLGLGYRSMNAKHSKLYGFNLFYDVQASVSGIGGYNPNAMHQRVGAGVEYFTGSVETRLNGYYGVSSDVQVGQTNLLSTFEHVAPGLDLSVGTDFSFWNAPWLKLTATGNYYAQTQSGTINVYNGSALNANLTAQLQVTPQLSINGGGTVGNGGQSNGNIGFQFNLLAPPVPALFLADPTINKLSITDISYKMLQQVQRNNTITVERYTMQTGTGTITGTISGLSSAVGVAISGLPSGAVVAWSGLNYSITNVAAGSQTLTFAKTGYTVTNSPQTVNVPAGGTVAVPATVNFTAVDDTGMITGMISGLSSAAGVAISGLPSGAAVAWSGLNYSITNVAAGSQTLTFAKTGYTVTNSPQTVIVPAGGTVAVPETVNFTRVGNSGQISGTVTVSPPIDGSSYPPVHTQVTLSLAGEPVALAFTDANGAYSFGSLAAGAYTASIGYTSTVGLVEGSTDVTLISNSDVKTGIDIVGTYPEPR